MRRTLLVVIAVCASLVGAGCASSTTAPSEPVGARICRDAYNDHGASLTPDQTTPLQRCMQDYGTDRNASEVCQAVWVDATKLAECERTFG